MQTRYTDDYPDVKKLKETIAALEKLKKDMATRLAKMWPSDECDPAQCSRATPCCS